MSEIQPQIKCSLSHNHDHQRVEPSNQIEHIIILLQQKFISPFKLIYMIDQKEADLFKVRNKLDSCCSSSSITIPKKDMSKLERIVAEKVDRGYLMANLQNIMEFCLEKFENVRKDGVKNKLQFNEDVEKFLIDKVLAQGVNAFLFKQIVKQLQKQGKSMGSEMGLWATPVTWYTQFPNIPLDFLKGSSLSQFDSQGFTIIDGFLEQGRQKVFEQLCLLEKDGKFQEILHKDSSLTNASKMLNSPDTIISSKSERFPALKSTFLKLKSIPFQLNAKMNAFCVVSQNLVLTYHVEGIHLKRQRSQKTGKSFEAFCLFGGHGALLIQGDSFSKEFQFKQGSTLLLNQSSKGYDFKMKQNSKAFGIRFQIPVIPKKQL